mgnify:CR=1
SKEQKTRAEQNLAKIDELAITYNNLQQEGPKTKKESEENIKSKVFPLNHN